MSAPDANVIFQSVGGLGGLIVRHLMKDGPLTSRQLADRCYAVSKMPEYPEKGIILAITKLRPKIALLGWAIVNNNLHGGYRLIPLTEQEAEQLESLRATEANLRRIQGELKSTLLSVQRLLRAMELEPEGEG